MFGRSIGGGEESFAWASLTGVAEVKIDVATKVPNKRLVRRERESKEVEESDERIVRFQVYEIMIVIVICAKDAIEQ